MHTGMGLAALSTSAAAAVVVAGSTAASLAASSPRLSGWVAVDSHGFTARAVAPTSSLERVTLRWRHGVSVRIRPSRRARVYLGYMVVTGPALPASFGELLVPAHRGPGRIRLAYRPPGQGLPGRWISGVLRTGRTPSLVLSGLPRGTTSVELYAGRLGRRSTGITAPCRHRERRYDGVMVVTLASGRRVPGQNHGGIACGSGIPETR